LLTIQHQHLIIKDFEALSALAGFEAAHLGRCRVPDGFKPLAAPAIQQTRPGSEDGREAPAPK
jgi:hypothetical protein